MSFETFKTWSERENVVLPINTEDISGFINWIDWNSYHPGRHNGFDFASYFTPEGSILGLPKKTPVRAIHEGIVRSRSIVTGDIIDYWGDLVIEHGENSGLNSLYTHVVPLPLVKIGDHVKRGQVIGELYADTGILDESFGRLVHLHLAIKEGGNSKSPEYQDPRILFPELSLIPRADPQGQINFTINGKPNTRIANYKTLIESLK